LLSLGAHHLLFQMVWGVMRPAINEVVRPQLGLRRYSRLGPYLFRSDLHAAKVINGFSTHVLPRPADWPDSSLVTGYWFLDEPQWRPPDALCEFLAAGPKPIYVGFGSMVSSNATRFTEVVLDAVKRSGQRAVLATGWGGLDHEGIGQSERVFFVRHAPHDWLLPRVSAAVHHGGAGTTAAAVRAGIPSVIVPFYGDQPFWARCLHRKGVAPPSMDRKDLSSDAMAGALKAAQHPAMMQRAFELGCAVREEDGVAEALRCLHGWGLLQQPAAEVAVHRRRTA
jgi:sterol 3beta-glucosyltransferase